MTPPSTENFRSPAKEAKALGTGGVVCTVAALVSHFAPVSAASFLVALVFLGATYLLCLRRDQLERPADFGLRLGGLLDPEPLSARQLFAAFGSSLAWALAVAALVFPLFAVAFPIYHNANTSFSFPLAFRGIVGSGSWLDVFAGQLLVVALPEEAFFRGYLQTRLRDSFPTSTSRQFRVGMSILLTSALFAVGHFATIPSPARLAVFFPSLLFGWLRERSGSIGPSVLLHALANLFSSALLAGYGLL